MVGGSVIPIRLKCRMLGRIWDGFSSHQKLDQPIVQAVTQPSRTTMTDETTTVDRTVAAWFRPTAMFRKVCFSVVSQRRQKWSVIPLGCAGLYHSQKSQHARPTGTWRLTPVKWCVWLSGLLVLTTTFGCKNSSSGLGTESPLGMEAANTTYVPSRINANSPHPSQPPEAQSPAIPPEMIPVYAPTGGLVQPSGYASGNTQNPSSQPPSTLSPEVAAAQANNANIPQIVGPNGTVYNNGIYYNGAAGAVPASATDRTPTANIAPSGYADANGQISPYATSPYMPGTAGALVPYTGGAVPPGYALVAPVYTYNPYTGAKGYQYVPVAPVTTAPVPVASIR